MQERELGLYQKYVVRRTGDLEGKHDDCWFFVLDLEHDPAAVVALRSYADAVREEYPSLAADLDARLEGR